MMAQAYLSTAAYIDSSPHLRSPTRMSSSSDGYENIATASNKYISDNTNYSSIDSDLIAENNHDALDNSLYHEEDSTAWVEKSNANVPQLAAIQTNHNPEPVGNTAVHDQAVSEAAAALPARPIPAANGHVGEHPFGTSNKDATKDHVRPTADHGTLTMHKNVPLTHSMVDGVNEQIASTEVSRQNSWASHPNTKAPVEDLHNGPPSDSRLSSWGSASFRCSTPLAPLDETLSRKAPQELEEQEDSVIVTPSKRGDWLADQDDSMHDPSLPEQPVSEISHEQDASESTGTTTTTPKHAGGFSAISETIPEQDETSATNLSETEVVEEKDESLLEPPANHHNYHRQPHRASSPPAFHGTRSPSLSVKPSHAIRPDRLVHRHTLGVPKSRGLRDSSEFSLTDSDNMALATMLYNNQAVPSSSTTTTTKQSPTTPTKRRQSLNLTRRATRSMHADAHTDEVPHDEDAARWTEHIKAKRASRRTRTDNTDEEKVLVGTKVDESHANWVTAYNMLTGIRHCVSRVMAKLDRELTPGDFKAQHKFTFDITGTELTPSARYDFKFKDYAPWVFRHLRAQFRIDPADYLVSLTAKYILTELGSPGKSGSFFYYSRDYKYIIKTIHKSEAKVLRKILPAYYKHVTENPNTLISQFYGLHRVKIPYGRKIHFVVMNNLFPLHKDVHSRFDLKGSTIGRETSPAEVAAKGPDATLKDLNWLDRRMHLEMGPIKKGAFLSQLQKDVALLKKLKLMDYSLLIGIHDLKIGNAEKLRDKTLRVFQPMADPAAGDAPQPGKLTRTPSKLETAKRAQELRNLVNKERPVPIDELLKDAPAQYSRKGFYFYTDDGGFRTTHEDNSLGNEILYVGIIDCLTRWSLVKRAENVWKGFKADAAKISPVAPEFYGDRFSQFIGDQVITAERKSWNSYHASSRSMPR